MIKKFIYVFAQSNKGPREETFKKYCLEFINIYIIIADF